MWATGRLIQIIGLARLTRDTAATMAEGLNRLQARRKEPMMDGFGWMGGGMAFGGFWMLLLLVVVVLSIAALVKYLSR